MPGAELEYPRPPAGPVKEEFKEWTAESHQSAAKSRREPSGAAGEPPGAAGEPPGAVGEPPGEKNVAQKRPKWEK